MNKDQREIRRKFGCNDKTRHSFGANFGLCSAHPFGGSLTFTIASVVLR